jgi:hypothetical protein
LVLGKMLPMPIMASGANNIIMCFIQRA